MPAQIDKWCSSMQIVDALAYLLRREGVLCQSECNVVMYYSTLYHQANSPIIGTCTNAQLPSLKSYLDALA